MAEVVIRVRDSGPFLIEGPVTVLDADGNEFPIDKTKPAIALCRCGTSAKKPFCDGSHKGTEFGPQKFDLAEKTKVWLCGCKHSDKKPFCDGAHKKL